MGSSGSKSKGSSKGTKSEESASFNNKSALKMIEGGSFLEMRTAKTAVLNAAPAANVETECVRTYPIKVAVILRKGGSEKTIFETDQRNLFSKYADKRQKAMKEIEEAVKRNM